jgi:hypothetical protein
MDDVRYSLENTAIGAVVEFKTQDDAASGLLTFE